MFHHSQRIQCENVMHVWLAPIPCMTLAHVATMRAYVSSGTPKMDVTRQTYCPFCTDTSLSIAVMALYRLFNASLEHSMEVAYWKRA